MTWQSGAMLMISGAFLVAALVLTGLAIRRHPARKPRGEPQPEPQKAQDYIATFGAWQPYIPTWEDEEFRQGREQKLALLKERGLNPISEFQDGLSASEIDPGSYGFLANLGRLGSDPKQILLNREPSRSSDESDFEVHRLADGTVEIIGFASKQDAHAIRSGGADCKASIFTRKTSNATELIAMPVSRISSATYSGVRHTAYRLDVRLKPGD
jgi:hypothetical protein